MPGSAPESSVVAGRLYTRWTSTGAFLLAAVGAGIGLGNIWRFPYVVGANGGAAFVVVYVLAAFGIVMPVLVAELIIGRRGGGSPVRSVAALARESGASPLWRYFGVAGMISPVVFGFLIQVTGNYEIPFLISAGLLAVGALASMFIDPTRKLIEPPADPTVGAPAPTSASIAQA